MGEAADTIRPIWRTRLAAALVAWMGLVVGATLASSRLLEVLPADVLPFAAVSLYITPIPIFLVWGFWAMLREPLTGWVAPTVVLAFCGAFVPAAKPLFDAGVALNFAARRPAYEAIVDDVVSGRLAAAPAEIGWTQGQRGEIRYAFQSSHRDLVQFIWSENPYLPSAVIYDAKSCGVPRPGQRRRIISSYDRHLGGHYCYVREFP
jgi:hypothetical protein